ncbi:MAG: glycogen synthase [Anaerolineae bacterium]|nr:glycogen synthase [Anaerolineae bacterium]
MSESLKVLLVAAEATPFAKVGGLADVAGALPKALRKLGIDARLIIPRYGNIRSDEYDLHKIGKSVPVPVGPGVERVHLLETTADGGVPVYLIWDDRYFSARERVYGFNDDPQRFVFFSRAVLSAIQALDWKPDVIHANDWHTGAIPAWLNVYGRQEPFYKEIATLFSIHNLAYQGICGRLILTFGQMADIPHLPIEPPGQVNWMAQGIAHADLVSTVSPTYAREILTGEYGMGLQSLLQERQDRLFGILNGLDTGIWDPSGDNALSQTFDSESLAMRAVNKATLQRDAHLPARADVPVLGWVSRLDPLKGFDIALPALEALFYQHNAQFILLGTGDSDYEARFKALQEQFPEQVRMIARFDDRLARKIYGGTDIFLAPSLSEPGGISQMMAMRYGAVPVVRATGSLSDTVLDADLKPERGTGFVFSDYTAEALLETLQRALAVWEDKDRWQSIQRRALEMDFSWGASARTYVDIYQRAQALRKSG